MSAYEVILIMSIVVYTFQMYFERMVYAPQPVESDPYWRKIYGTEEFSPELLREKKRLEEEQKDIEMAAANEQFQLSIVSDYPTEEIEVSTDQEADDFIRQLQSEFGGTATDTSEEEPVKSVSNENKTSKQLELGIKYNSFVFQEDDDFLDVSELDLPIYQDFPSSSISSEIEGPQQWFVVVVGKEGTYLHVSDGRKKWIDAGIQADEISINDTLMLMVEVTEGKIDVLDMVIMSQDIYH